MIITSVFSLIHGVKLKMNGSTEILTKWIDNVQREMSNTNVQYKKRKESEKTSSSDVKSKRRV